MIRIQIKTPWEIINTGYKTIKNDKKNTKSAKESNLAPNSLVEKIFLARYPSKTSVKAASK